MVHRLEQRNAEALVLAQAHVHVGGREVRAEDRFGHASGDVDGIDETERFDVLRERTRIARDHRPTDDPQPRVRVEVAAVDRERLHDVVLGLVRADLTDEQPRRRTVGSFRRQPRPLVLVDLDV